MLRPPRRIAAWRHRLLILPAYALMCAAFAPPLLAQKYSLQLRPRAGDTLRVKMEQTTDFEGVPAGERVDPGKMSPDSASERSGIVVFTRIAVEATDLGGAEVTAITDSVRLTGQSSGSPVLEAAARTAEGRRVRLRVAPDGATTLAGNDAANASLRAMMTQMPSTLPREPVAVGQTWVRTMEIPVAPATYGGGSAALSGTFRLDSVSRGGDIAYVSLKGRLARSSNVPSRERGNRRRGERGAVVSTSGSITGHLVIDRERGWIVDVLTTVVSRSLMQEGSSAAATARMWMKITQRVVVY